MFSCLFRPLPDFFAGGAGRFLSARFGSPLRAVDVGRESRESGPPSLRMRAGGFWLSHHPAALDAPVTPPFHGVAPSTGNGRYGAKRGAWFSLHYGAVAPIAGDTATIIIRPTTAAYPRHSRCNMGGGGLGSAVVRPLLVTLADAEAATHAICISDEGRFDLSSRRSRGCRKVADGGSPNNA